MNMVLLEAHDFVGENRVRLIGRRCEHICKILGASMGSELRVGVLGGRMGHGRIERLGADAIEMTIALESDPPVPLPLRLVLALPRPKVLNRTIAAAASLGIRDIHLINSWRVEKSYWKSPRLSAENLRMQCILGLEQAGDTILPAIHMHRLFTPFVRDELPKLIEGSLTLVAHPGRHAQPPGNVTQPVVLAIGPEGGFIEREVSTFRNIGFDIVSLGPRILRVETAVPFLAGRLFSSRITESEYGLDQTPG
jgi:16S rRNA (uracil1498-N3)-methyltransferase